MLHLLSSCARLYLSLTFYGYFFLVQNINGVSFPRSVIIIFFLPSTFRLRIFIFTENDTTFPLLQP